MATDTVAQQLRVSDGFPLLMLSRIIFGSSQEPVVFSQDFLRGDYARIHADAQLEPRSPSIDHRHCQERRSRQSQSHEFGSAALARRFVILHVVLKRRIAMAEMVAPAAAKGKKLYARKSSGLVRTIGVFGAMVFGVHCISLSSSGLIPFSWVAGVWPGSSIIGVLTVAMFFCLFHAYTYSVIGATMPRSAADYTLASRTLSAPLAFAASWTLVIFSAMVAGSLIAWIPKTAIPGPLPHDGHRHGEPGFRRFRHLVSHHCRASSSSARSARSSPSS